MALQTLWGCSSVTFCGFLDRASANHGPQAKSSLPPVFANKVLLEHSHANSFTEFFSEAIQSCSAGHGDLWPRDAAMSGERGPGHQRLINGEQNIYIYIFSPQLYNDRDFCKYIHTYLLFACFLLISLGCWPLNNTGSRGADPPCHGKSTCNLWSFLLTRGPSKSTRFKLMLFKGPLIVQHSLMLWILHREVKKETNKEISRKMQSGQVALRRGQLSRDRKAMREQGGHHRGGRPGQRWWNRAGPCGAPGLEAFQTAANQGREGMRRWGRRSQDTVVQPWGRVLVPPQGIHTTISLSSFTELKPPTNRRC